MVKKIMRDPLFLAQKSVDATEDDKQVVTDLLDTLRANLDHLFIRKAHLPEQNSKFMLPRIFTQQTTRRMQTETVLSITARVTL